MLVGACSTVWALEITIGFGGQLQFTYIAISMVGYDYEYEISQANSLGFELLDFSESRFACSDATRL